MRKTILVALIAAAALPTVAPVAASAQTHELNRDRQDIRKEQRELDHAYRTGTPHDVREERRDVRDARREYREDWRDYRSDHRNVYARGAWRAPFGYQRFAVGTRMKPAYYDSRYYIRNPAYYRLPPAPGYARWIRHYDDVLLVNIRTGAVITVHRGFFW